MSPPLSAHDSPRAHDPDDKAPPAVGLALGGGAARGWAHIGIIRALERMGIHPRVVAGTSVGALVGAAYARGRLDDMDAWVRDLRWDYFFRYGDLKLTGGGFVPGNRLLHALRPIIAEGPIEMLPVRFGCVATDLETGREVWFDRGSLHQAIRASISIPGVFTPVRHEGRWLVDGGLVNPVPVSLCRALGARHVIAVNLNADVLPRRERRERREGGRAKPRSRVRAERREREHGLTQLFLEGLPDIVRPVLARIGPTLVRRLVGPGDRRPSVMEAVNGALNVMQDRITRSRMAGDPADVVLAPRLADIALLDFDRAEEAIAEGEATVERMATLIEDALGT